MQKLKAYTWYIAFFLLLIVFTLLTDFNGLYGQDSYEYLRYTNCLLTFFKTGASTGSFFWPVLYPIIGSLFSFVFKPVFGLQLISMVSFIGAAVYVKKTIVFLHKPHNESVNWFMLLFFLLSPYMLRASIVVMSDMLAVFFLSAAYYYFFRYRDLPIGRHLLVFVFFSVAAVATRYASFVLLLIPACYVGITFIKNFRGAQLFLLVLVVSIVFLPHIILNLNQPFSFIKHEWIKDWSLMNLFKNSFTTIDGNAHYTVLNLVYSFFNLFHPAFCFAGVLLVWFSIKWFRNNRSKEIIILAISVFVYALFLAGIPFQNLRFLLLSFPMVAILLFPGFNYISGEFNTKRIGVYIVILLIQLALFCRVFLPFYHYNKIEKQIAMEVLKYPGIPIYTFSMEGALKGYGVKNEIISLYTERLDTVPKSIGEKLILFNESQFAEEWKGKNPMINWSYLNNNFKLSKIEDLPDGWSLYKVN